MKGINTLKTNGYNWLNATVNAAPLAWFRVAFGVLMLFSTVRFVANGWVNEFYIQPAFMFKYPGFGWVGALPGGLMYLPFAIMAFAAILLALGWYYRWAAAAFFIAFTYVELLDATYYLNHYYFVSLAAFLLIWLPANRCYALDAKQGRVQSSTQLPRLLVYAPAMLLGIVYVYAGMAKINTDWLLEALPLKMWLPVHAHLPIVGPLLAHPAMAYVFSWFGCVYDLTIPFLLLWHPTRYWALAAVVVFHGLTAMLFPIGVFPWVMIMLSPVFLPAHITQRWLGLLPFFKPNANQNHWHKPSLQPALSVFLIVFFVWQLAFPWRYLLYGPNLFWHEQGYRLSWRVMLMEKAGYVFFYTTDQATGQLKEFNYHDFLTPNQIKMMATQPDFIIQFAKHLSATQATPTNPTPPVYAKSYVTLNGSGSRPFFKPDVNLAQANIFDNYNQYIFPFFKKKETPTHSPRTPKTIGIIKCYPDSP